MAETKVNESDLLEVKNNLKAEFKKLKVKRKEELAALKAEYNALSKEEKANKKEEFNVKVDNVKNYYEKKNEEIHEKLHSLKEDPTFVEQEKQNNKVKSSRRWRSFKAFWRGQKVRYFVRRILSTLLTLLLLVFLIKGLLSLLPDSNFYSIQEYSLLKSKYGENVANNWLRAELIEAGRVHADGTRVSIFESVGTFLYRILPFYKKIAVVTSANNTGEVLEYWEGFVYLGISNRSNEYISDIFKERMGISFEISIISIVITYAIGYPWGIAMAKKPGGVTDRIGTVFIVLNYAIPSLVFYLFMQRILGDNNGPFAFLDLGLTYDASNPRFKDLIPAIFCISFLSIPGVIIWLRRFMVDELNSDYVKFARSKGLSENRIMYTHVLRNAFVPLARNIPGTFIGAIVGSYFVEKIWAIPGTGFLLTSSLSVSNFDMPVVESVTFIYAALSMVVFLLGDLTTILFDPRIKLAGD